MNKAKSISPKQNPVQSKSRLALQKLVSLSKPKPNIANDSILTVSSQDSNESLLSLRSPANLSHNSQVLNLNLSKSNPSFRRASQRKATIPSLVTPTALKSPSTPKRFFSIKHKNSPKENIGEHLLPLKSEEVIKAFTGMLSKFELSELLDYQDVYYLGLKSEKVQPTVRMSNMGFDDDKSDYKLVIGDHLAYQYEILELLGTGAFAQVCRCWDYKHKREVAIKILKSQKVYLEQGQNELKILSFLKKSEKKSSSFIQAFEYFMFRCHLCIVFELLSFSLFDLLKANNFKPFSTTLVRRFTIQILSCLQTLRSLHIIHCDLKPENIILSSPNESNIKLIDFGSSCFENEKIYTYIQSRIYRAPEVILGLSYSVSIDMWSLGCIICELLTGLPLFFGENEIDQLYAIIEVLGLPPDQLLKSSAKRYKLFGSEGLTRTYKNSHGKVRVPSSHKLENIFPNDVILLDFLKRKTHLGCFEWMPDRRMTPTEALSHPFMLDSRKLKSPRKLKSMKNCKSPREKSSLTLYIK